MRPKGDPQQLFGRRLAVVRRVGKDGLSQAAAASEAGMHRNAVGTWVGAYRGATRLRR